MKNNEVQTELAELSRLKEEFDQEMVSALKTNKLDRAVELKAQLEERISKVQELLLPPGSFNKEQREALEGRGFVIVRLTGESLKSLRDKGNNFQSIWHEGYFEFENKTSRLTEVAFNPDPDKFFLPDSNLKTLFQQQDMVDKYSKELQQELKTKGITGVKAVIGEAPDYIELAFGYTGKYGPLFGKEYSYRYTRTQTYLGSVVAGVGVFTPGIGLLVNYGGSDVRDGFLWVAPLVVPPSS